MREPTIELDRLANDVIGAAIEVHRNLGPGFLESVYEKALCKELELRDIPYSSQQTFSIEYKDSEVGAGRIDLLVGSELIVEIKAVSELAPIHSAQIMSYLKANNKLLGLLINFNVPLLKNGIKRIIFSQD